jgi:hypothetical protein
MCNETGTLITTYYLTSDVCHNKRGKGQTSTGEFPTAKHGSVRNLIFPCKIKARSLNLSAIPYRTSFVPMYKKNDSESTDIQMIETKVGKTGKREIILYFQYIGIS